MSRLPIMKRATAAVARSLGYVPQEEVVDTKRKLRRSQRLLKREEMEEYSRTERQHGVNLPYEMTTLTGVYRNSSWVYSSIYAIASHVASVPVRFYRGEVADPDKKPLESNHYLWRLWAKPNRWTSGYDLVEGIVTYLEISGNAYFEIEYDQGGDPAHLYLLRADKVKPVPDPKNRVKGYVYDVKHGHDIRYDVNEVTQFRYFNPLNELLGQSPMQAAIAALTTDFWSIGSTNDVFKNAGKMENTVNSSPK